MAKKKKYQKTLPTYQSEKIVGALVIASVVRRMNGTATIAFEKVGKDEFEPIEVNDAFVRKHDPKKGQVYVVYANKGVSVSPKDIFDEGYSKVDTEGLKEIEVDAEVVKKKDGSDGSDDK